MSWAKNVTVSIAWFSLFPLNRMSRICSAPTEVLFWYVFDTNGGAAKNVVAESANSIYWLSRESHLFATALNFY